MELDNWFSKRKDDKWKVLVVLSLLVIFLIWKAIIESGHLLYYIVFLVLWVAVYYFFEFIQKRKITKPASLWKAYAKKYPIIIQYGPPKWINPAEAWLLYNCSVETTDLTSLIYQWKFEKLIDIKTFKWENTKRDYIKLIKIDDMPLSRPLFESEIFDSIFRMWDIKIIEWPFQLRYALMLEDLEYHWIQKWWICKKKSDFKKSNNDKFWEASFVGMFYLFALIMSMIMEYVEVSMDFSIFIWFIAIIFFIVLWVVSIYWNMDGWWNLKFTEKWAELASQVIWYSQFIKSCDEDKIKLFLKEDPLFIDRTLPYATAFWMETEFLKKISPLKNDWNAKYYKWKKIPSWVWILRFFRNEDSLF